MKYSTRLLILLFSLLQSASIFAQKIEDTDFWWVMPPNNGAGVPYLIIQADQAANVTVEYVNLSGAGKVQNIVISPGAQTMVELGNGSEKVGTVSIYPGASFKIENCGVHVTSDKPISVYAVNASYVGNKTSAANSASLDGETVLPTKFLGKSYVAASRSSFSPGGTLPLINEAAFTVLATENATNITIKTYHESQNGKYARDTIVNIVLNAGQTYKCAVNTALLTKGNLPMTTNAGATAYPMTTGDCSRIIADKPIAVVGHSKCSWMVDNGACDMMMNQMLPVEKWGTSYALAQATKRDAYVGGNYTVTSGDFIQIFGKVGQSITIEACSGTKNLVIPSLPFSTTSNDNYGFIWYDNAACPGAEANGEADVYITSAQPFGVLQLQKDFGTDCAAPTGCLNDAETVIVYPTNMWESSYLTSTLTNIATAYIIIVVPNLPGVTASILVDKAAPVGGSWQVFANGKYAFYRHNLLLASGGVGSSKTHRIESTGATKFGFYVVGQSTAGSYIVQGGGTPLINLAVPIELLTFTGALKGTAVELKWTTATERENTSYTIQRSGDGASFTDIGSVEGNGASSNIRKYSFIDSKPLRTNNYYRLVQKGSDGKHAYSNILAIDGLLKATFNLLKVYPVPSSNQVMLSFVAKGEDEVSLALYDLTGRCLLRNKVQSVDGVNNYSISISDLQKGIYTLELLQSGEKVQSRIVKE